MSNLYNAMQHAERERGGPGSVSAGPGKRYPRGLEEKLLGLYQRLESLTHDGGGRAVQLVGLGDGSDSTRLSKALARIVSRQLGRRVLLLEAHAAKGTLNDFSTVGLGTLQEVLNGNIALHDAHTQDGDSALYVGRIASTEDHLSQTLAHGGLPNLMQELRHQFELLLLDAPPMGASSDALLSAKLLDATVFTVDASRTRWQAARTAMEQMDAQRAKTLGVLLYNQRYHIPRWIYDKLL